jgi:hypothetical protein
MRISVKPLFTLAIIFLVLFVCSLNQQRKKLSELTDVVSKTKTLAFYAYFEKNALYVRTLKFFIEIGVKESETGDFVFKVGLHLLSCLIIRT